MPIIIDPTFVAPPPPSTVTSADGVLTVTVDSWAGAVLTADFSALAPERVRFLRADGTTVRSGDTALAPGGVAVAYDHEAPLGSTVGWYAVPIMGDGTEGAASGQAAVEIPDPTDVDGDVWLKSVLDPSLSMRVWMQAPPTFARAGRVATQDIAGTSLPVASWDVRSGIVTSLALGTNTEAQRKGLDALLDSGPLLFQAASRYDVEDFYLLPGDVTTTWAVDASDPQRDWTVAVTQVDRPATLDSPLLIPGNSWDTVQQSYATWTEVESQVSSWIELLGG